MSDTDAYNLVTKGFALVREENGGTAGKFDEMDTLGRLFYDKSEVDDFMKTEDGERMTAEGWKIVPIGEGYTYGSPQTKWTIVEDQDPPFEPGDKVTSLNYDKGEYVPVKVLKNGKLKNAHSDWYFSEYIIGPEKTTDENGDTYYNIEGLKDQTKTTGFLVGDYGTEYPIYVNEKYLTSAAFDTGGYTGSWDSSGRLAMLHQKEIVLNAHDTENFLAAVNIVRDIASAIDLRAVAYEYELARMGYVNAIGGASQTLQ